MTDDRVEKKPSVDRLPYQSPRLVVYGDLRVLTQTMRMSGNDGGVMAG